MTNGNGARSTRLGTCLLATALLLYVALQIASAQEPPKNFLLHSAAKPVAKITFDDAEGHARNLAEFRGKVLLLNIWATWCVPCRKEMPSLDRLQASLGGPDFQVMPVSIDRGGLDTIHKFYAEIGIRNLPTYADTSGEVLRKVLALGLPTTLLIDRAGQEIGRIVGPAEWDTPEVAEFLKPFINNRPLAVGQADRGPSQPQSDSPVKPPGVLTRSINWLRALLDK